MCARPLINTSARCALGNCVLKRSPAVRAFNQTSQTFGKIVAGYPDSVRLPSLYSIGDNAKSPKTASTWACSGLYAKKSGIWLTDERKRR
jgi:hypothetical protein